MSLREFHEKFLNVIVDAVFVAGIVVGGSASWTMETRGPAGSPASDDEMDLMALTEVTAARALRVPNAVFAASRTLRRQVWKVG
ncbi:hypothetical protein HPB50_027520 [Hyalomma asiaticum]|uniref:Uncharacterized protein n=1 Tax=Hyalomma asiaticum TaxID=266040 RepID=A0ACB7STQ3_HYAAI|nr:hypothetical protein HPB50_027520 [Hyalomma asiaticum]